jgi:hypothetical protein
VSTFLTRIAATDAGRPPRSAGQPASGRAFTGLAVTSFGGPLALAALYAPASVAGASGRPAEYFALSRLISTITSWRLRPVIIALGAALVLSAPVTLINPDRIYSLLIKPSLIALWLSQLMVFAVYPRFAARQQDRRLPAWALTVVATAFALYGLWVTIQHSAT